MYDIGPQYPNDDRTDSSGFMKRARLHQSRFRCEVLAMPYDTYGNYLTPEDGASGKNFYNGFGIFKAVQKYRKYNKNLYSNMLRSEHIPFNIFVPLDKNKEYCRAIFNEFLGGTIRSVDLIQIEYAPKPKEKYLNDATSFDAYVEYTHVEGSRGAIGIEVKYTEKEYKLAANSKQEKEVLDKSSKYYSVSEACRLYKPDALAMLPSDKFRQVWRNHLLGESMLQADGNNLQHFTSITLFPMGNSHFLHTSREYIALLNSNEYKFIPVTYEEFFEAAKKTCPDNNYLNWIEYLNQRYLFTS